MPVLSTRDVAADAAAKTIQLIASIPTLTPRPYLAPRGLNIGRDSINTESTSNGPGISATAIALIVCVGVIPVLITGGFVIWLLFFYGHDRLCCPCFGRKKGKDQGNFHEEKNEGDGEFSTGSSENVKLKELVKGMGLPHPMAPQRPGSVLRADSVMSRQSSRTSVEQVMKEPEPFV